MGFILTHPHKKLRTICNEVRNFDTDEMSSDLDIMRRTLRRTKGLGLAANQLGQTDRIIYVKLSTSVLQEMINPKIIKESGEQFEVEGCLSVPHYFSKIKRALHVEVEFQDKMGEKKSLTLSGIEAVEVQHEIDHLNGILFIDHLPKTKQIIFKEKYRKIIKNIKRGKLKGANDG